MPEILYKNLKISSLTKNRLDKSRGRMTYDKFLDKVLEYFEMTGIDPKHDRLPPAVSINNTIKDATDLLNKRIEDSIKILRNIETRAIIPMQKGIETLLKGEAGSDPENLIGPKEQEMYQLIEIVENQKDEIKIKETIIDNLQKELLTKKKASSNISESSKIQDIISTIEELLSERTLSIDKFGNFIMTREYRKQLIEKIKTYSNV